MTNERKPGENQEAVPGSGGPSGEHSKLGCAVVLGATSPIAKAFCRQAGEVGYSVFAAARSAEAAAAIAADVAIRTGARTASGAFDALQCASHKELLDDAEAQLGPITLVLVAFGDMGQTPEPGQSVDDVHKADSDFSNRTRVLNVNFTGAASASEAAVEALLRSVGNEFDSSQPPTLVAIGSVAGDRGRQSNYTYGAAKGGFALYLQGLRNRMFKHGVRVVTVKFGFIDTPMTYGMKTAVPIASPEAAASALLKAAAKSKDVLYFPWFWRWIMLIIRAIPERLFKRLSM